MSETPSITAKRDGEEKVYRIQRPLGTMRVRVATRILTSITSALVEVDQAVNAWVQEYRSTHTRKVTREQTELHRREMVRLLEQGTTQAGEELSEEQRLYLERAKAFHEERLAQMADSGEGFIEVEQDPTAQEIQAIRIRKMFEAAEYEAFLLTALMLIPESELEKGWDAPREEQEHAVETVLEKFVREVLDPAPAVEVSALAVAGGLAYQAESTTIRENVGKAVASWAQAQEAQDTEDEEDDEDTGAEGSTTSSPESSTGSPSATAGESDGSSSESPTTDSSATSAESTPIVSV